MRSLGSSTLGSALLARRLTYEPAGAIVQCSAAMIGYQRCVELGLECLDALVAPHTDPQNWSAFQLHCTRDVTGVAHKVFYVNFRARNPLDGLFSPRDAKLAIALLMAAVEAAAKVASLRGDPEDAVVDELTHMVLGYVL
jgi:hypothetical protein